MRVWVIRAFPLAYCSFFIASSIEENLLMARRKEALADCDC
jgi:hypothetical protein